MRYQRSTGSKGLLNLHQLFEQLLLVLDFYQVRHTIGSPQLTSLVLVAAKKQVPAKQGQQRLYCPPALAPNLPAHRKKVAHIFADQVMSEGLFVPALGMSHPPFTLEITNRFGFRPDCRRIFAYFQQFYSS
jgi:hypothetical protein